MPDLVNLAELHTLVPVIWPVIPSPVAKASPRFLGKYPTGFPCPAADYVESGLDLNDYLVKHRAATFVFDVCGDSMCGVGIYDGDKIVVDRAIEARHGMIIVAIVNGEHTIKRLHMTGQGIELWPENPCYRPIRLKEHEELVVFGVVVGVVKKMQG
jgi:DNA polymerase V